MGLFALQTEGAKASAIILVQFGSKLVSAQEPKGWLIEAERRIYASVN